MDDHFATFLKSHLVLASIGTAIVTLQCVGQTKDKHDPVVHLDERFSGSKYKKRIVYDHCFTTTKTPSRLQFCFANGATGLCAIASVSVVE